MSIDSQMATLRSLLPEANVELSILQRSNGGSPYALAAVWPVPADMVAADLTEQGRHPRITTASASTVSGSIHVMGRVYDAPDVEAALALVVERLQAVSAVAA
ncbi:hypothetical protein SEA_MORGANA_62 [Gordonia phage Morgana]|uniref:Uncharacterized protein n=1 Tax=Gordonia phage Morgana TaxID=3137292 RepID=A0AAX4RBR1_9CAUD